MTGCIHDTITVHREIVLVEADMIVGFELAWTARVVMSALMRIVRSQQCKGVGRVPAAEMDELMKIVAEEMCFRYLLHFMYTF